VGRVKQLLQILEHKKKKKKTLIDGLHITGDGLSETIEQK
jgi:hypothetical protein